MTRSAAETVASVGEPSAREEAERYRRLERDWQNTVGYALLDKPYDAPGSDAVWKWQWGRILARIDPDRPGVVLEIGCGKGHFLHHLRDRLAPRQTLVGADVSRAVFSLPSRGLAGVQADGEFLPFREGSAAYVIYDGALHHLIDYRAALDQAVRLLKPGGDLIVFEPVSSWFSRLAHRLLDPIVFRRAVVYESPIDIRYKGAFSEAEIVRVLRACGLQVEKSRSDFLAYPFTGCYAGSVFSRSERFMRFLIAVEEAIEATPVLRSLARVFAWRFLIVARRQQ